RSPCSPGSRIAASSRKARSAPSTISPRRERGSTTSTCCRYTGTWTCSWERTRRATYSRRFWMLFERTDEEGTRKVHRMRLPRRIGAETGRYSLIDGIPFELPVASHHSPALMAAFSIDADKAAELLPGRELHPLLLSQNRGLLMITVVDYTSTNIGKYIEFSIAIFVTHGLRA